jgi:serine/threonine protein phosphatase 1
MGLKLLFTRPPKSPAVPEHMVVFAIGDIHGRADLARLVLDLVIAELEDSLSEKTVLVGLGDYVDRGPQSREVIDSLLAMTEFKRLDCQFLRGNHEEILLTFLTDAKAGPAWCDFGGRETLESYGVETPSDPYDAMAWEQTRADFNEALPSTHRTFFESLKPYYVAGDYVFVHAGLRPGVALEDQRDSDLIWIRKPFLTSRRAFSRVVVHGHSPTPVAHIDHRRIGLDTGAYASEVLSLLRLEGSARWLVQTFPTGDGQFDLRGEAV